VIVWLVNDDPIVNASELCDDHVAANINTISKILSTTHRVVDGVLVTAFDNSGYITNKKRWQLFDQREIAMFNARGWNDWWCLWARKSTGNYKYLVNHFWACLAEYAYRFDKHHRLRYGRKSHKTKNNTYTKCTLGLSYMLQSPPNNLTSANFTECVTPSYNSIEYYAYMMKYHPKRAYTKRERPSWLSNKDQVNEE
jgi:hypothetical protein